jgi:ATP-dependent Lhr-like helicase
LSAFDQLDPLVQHHIVNTLGWRGLRPLQEACIEPIQSGEHCLLLAPTAGGKTEAATFPVLSRICEGSWTGLSVIYVCPLKALLNNLHPRLEEYCRMVGRRCELWHGDIGPSQRNRIKADPPDILLTTPESLEVMLISSKEDGREMLQSVRVVIIDEIHAFAGDDRGWHLLAVLERIGRLAKREIQRIGLSATVGNPEELLEWLAGHCQRPRRVIQPTTPGNTAETDVQLDYVGSLQNAAIVISRLYRGEKRLVFCDSRSRVEELGILLRELNVSTFLSHSSLSAEERRDSEVAFAEGQDCVIVATSTLELGIDVGDLDRVIQIDAPWSVASFLQRLGRTGRRAGSTRNCLFLTTTDNALLRAAALLALWKDDYLEPVESPKHPLHLFAQQIMALALQTGGIGQEDWQKMMVDSPIFGAEDPKTLKGIVDYMLEEGILWSDGARLVIGDAGEGYFGRRHFMDLISVFTSDPVFKVLHGRKELGSVDQVTFLRERRDDQPIILSLGGRSWLVQDIDWKARQAQVIPEEGKGKSQWLGTGQGMSFRFARKVQEILASEDNGPEWSSRTKDAMEGLRNFYNFISKDDDLIIANHEKDEFHWYTFAGASCNLAIASCLNETGYDPAYSDDFKIRGRGAAKAYKAIQSVKYAMAEGLFEGFEIKREIIEALKFHQALPEKVAQELMRTRLFDEEIIQEQIQRNVVFFE